MLVLLIGIGAVGARRVAHRFGSRTAPALIVSSPPVHVIRDTLRSGTTVSQLFERRGVTGVDWRAVSVAASSFHPSRLRSGLEFVFRQRHGEDAPHEVAVRVSPESRVWVRRAAGGEWAAEVERIPWRVEPMTARGTILTTLYDAMDAAVHDTTLPQSERHQLVWALSDVYDWTVDFSRDVQTGDRFRVLAERLVSIEGEVRYGRVLAARLEVGTRPLYAFRFDDERGGSEFFDDSARSLKRELLRAPLEFRRIASGFSQRRFHPILRYYRPHWGIDFGAAYGAPVRSVGDGTVIHAGRLAGYGNMVEVRHRGSVTSRYAHLARLGPGIQEGVRIGQGQTVGYVGASGLATSPHLHYELRVNGRGVNPRRYLAAGQGRPVPAARREVYFREMARLRTMLESESAVTPRVTGTRAAT
jgi:murein DD-endopeptidase MepM/ murein hydrolase activator NlpD